jgi:hypothetical protein
MDRTWTRRCNIFIQRLVNLAWSVVNFAWSVGVMFSPNTFSIFMKSVRTKIRSKFVCHHKVSSGTPAVLRDNLMTGKIGKIWRQTHAIYICTPWLLIFSSFVVLIKLPLVECWRWLLCCLMRLVHGSHWWSAGGLEVGIIPYWCWSCSTVWHPARATHPPARSLPIIHPPGPSSR